MCPNNNELHIYDASTWEIKHQLFEHDLVISGMDWSPQSNYIVTCSHDRNAFTPCFDEADGKWKPGLVILRIDRAALEFPREVEPGRVQVRGRPAPSACPCATTRTTTTGG